ncbi:MAG: Rod shape-determining protein MreC [Acidobacteriaceae bacterium]|nr:Rod shape-determining protein MreC [Acidobacteriaceae bacterium]
MGRYRNVSFLAAAIFLQILGLAVQVKRSSENQPSRLIRVWAVSAITPPEKALVRVQNGASDIWHNYFYLRGVRQENRELREQIEQLQLDQVRLKQDADQAHRLQMLLGFKEQFISKTLAAQVIGSSGSEQSRTVYIDKGSRDGIQLEMAVISAAGVVGRVINVFKSTSQVLLINDQQSGVGAILEQSRLQGVLKGKSSGELVIDKIMADEEVKPGDRVLTSGGDQIFPKGLIVGTVDKIEKGPEFLQVSVKPTAALNRLEEVLVIVRKEEREPPSTATGMRASDILAERLPSVPDKPAVPANVPGSAARGAIPTNGVRTHPVAPGGASQTAGQAKAPAGAGSTAAKPITPVPGSASGSTGAPGSKPATPSSNSAAAPNAKSSPTNSKPVANTTPSQPQPNPPGDTPQ